MEGTTYCSRTIGDLVVRLVLRISPGTYRVKVLPLKTSFDSVKYSMDSTHHDLSKPRISDFVLDKSF